MIKQYKPKKRKLKVGRVIFVSLIIWLSILGFLSLFNTSNASSKVEKEFKDYTVTRGETLWSIAKSEKKTNNYFEDKSIQEIIYIIKVNNDLENETVCENQKIKIRVY